MFLVLTILYGCLCTTGADAEQREVFSGPHEAGAYISSTTIFLDESEVYDDCRIDAASLRDQGSGEIECGSLLIAGKMQRNIYGLHSQGLVSSIRIARPHGNSVLATDGNDFDNEDYMKGDVTDNVEVEGPMISFTGVNVNLFVTSMMNLVLRFACISTTRSIHTLGCFAVNVQGMCEEDVPSPPSTDGCDDPGYADNDDEREARLDSNIRILYHQTSPSIAAEIIDSGQMLRGTSGLAGGGIYFAENPGDTTYKATMYGCILECEVRLGNVKTIAPGGDPSIHFWALFDDGFDSVYIPRKRPEFVVYNRDQVRRCALNRMLRKRRDNVAGDGAKIHLRDGRQERLPTAEVDNQTTTRTPRPKQVPRAVKLTPKGTVLKPAVSVGNVLRAAPRPAKRRFRSGDWECQSCGNHNFACREKCNLCHASWGEWSNGSCAGGSHHGERGSGAGGRIGINHRDMSMEASRSTQPPCARTSTIHRAGASASAPPTTAATRATPTPPVRV